MFGKLFASVELFNNFSCFQVEIVKLRGVIGVVKDHARFVLMQNDISWMKNLLVLILQEWEPHVVLQPLSALFFIDFSLLIDLDNRSLDNKCPIVALCLNRLWIFLVIEIAGFNTIFIGEA